ncbi:MAG: RraA family protein [Chthoniobacterales bacterium]
MDKSDLIATIDALRRLDTCAVANAIEQLDVRLRNEGYTNPAIQCQTMGRSSMVGFADTVRIRTSPPKFNQGLYSERTDWWQHLASIPEPRILVVEEVDLTPTSGAFVGEVHAGILSALGCIAVVTNGMVRDIPKLAELGFAAFSSGVTVSHAYVHIVEYGSPVCIGGLTIHPGDLLHGDRHGIVNVPKDTAPRLPEIARSLRRNEKRILDYCASKEFSVEGLTDLLAT